MLHCVEFLPHLNNQLAFVHDLLRARASKGFHDCETTMLPTASDNDCVDHLVVLTHFENWESARCSM